LFWAIQKTNNLVGDEDKKEFDWLARKIGL
jgi:hypothetical protein